MKKGALFLKHHDYDPSDRASTTNNQQPLPPPQWTAASRSFSKPNGRGLYGQTRRATRLRGNATENGFKSTKKADRCKNQKTHKKWKKIETISLLLSYRNSDRPTCYNLESLLSKAFLFTEGREECT